MCIYICIDIYVYIKCGNADAAWKEPKIPTVTSWWHLHARESLTRSPVTPTRGDIKRQLKTAASNVLTQRMLR